MTKKLINNFSSVAKLPPQSDLYESYRMVRKYYTGLSEIIKSMYLYRNSRKHHVQFLIYHRLIMQKRKVAGWLMMIEKRIEFTAIEQYFKISPADYVEIIVYYEDMIRGIKEEIHDARKGYEAALGFNSKRKRQGTGIFREPGC